MARKHLYNISTCLFLTIRIIVNIKKRLKSIAVSNIALNNGILKRDNGLFILSPSAIFIDTDTAIVSGSAGCVMYGAPNRTSRYMFQEKFVRTN